MFLKKFIDLIFILPKIFFLSFLFLFLFTVTVIIFELLAFSLLLPLLTMLSNNVMDMSSFPNIISTLNDYSIKILNFNFLFDLKSITIAIFFVFLIKVIIQFILTWITGKIARDAHHFYAVRLFNEYINKDYKFHQKNSPSILFRNLTTEISNFTAVIIFQLLSVCVEVGIILSIFIFIFIIEPKIIFVILILILIVGLVYFTTKKILKLYGDKRAFFEDKRISTIQNSFEVIKDIIVYDISKIFSKSFDYTNFNLQKASFVLKILNSVPRYLFEITGVLVLVVTIFLFSDNESNNSFQIIGLFLLAAFRAMPSISKIASTFQQLIFLRPSLDIVHKELSIKLKNKSVQNKRNLKLDFKNKISLKNVSYSYPSRNKKKNIKLLNNINTTFYKGDKIGIEGESGFGKSTLADLILGLIHPDEGLIKVDNKFLDNQNSIEWRKKIGYISQKVTLLNGGIKENIILDKKFDKIKFLLIIKKCKLVNLYNKRKRDDNITNQMTNKISSGEAQRIGIARALYQDPEIIVLDEATNALDYKTEKQILNYIYSLKNITLFVIAHNNRALFGCNKIINFFRKGKLSLRIKT